MGSIRCIGLIVAIPNTLAIELLSKVTFAFRTGPY